MDYVVYYDSSSDLSSSDFLEHAEKLEKLQVPKGRNNVTVGNLRACSWYRFRIGTTSNTCPFSSELVLRTKEGEKQAVSCSCTVLLLVFFSLFIFIFLFLPFFLLGSSEITFKELLSCNFENHQQFVVDSVFKC